MPFALIVEDDSQSREMFRHVLESIGYMTAEATTGVEAISMLQTSTPDLVVLDIRLPQVKGDVILDYIYGAPHLQRTRVVVITAYGSLPSNMSLREGDLFFTKPLNIRALREAALDVAVRN